MLKTGDTGLEVRRLQQLLNQSGARLHVDGWFGDATAAAVIAAQRQYGLVVDGIAGPKTIATLTRGDRPAKLLGAGDLARAAERLGVPLAAIRAVNEVESRGNGFLDDGRPVILFERHIMYLRLAARDLDADRHAQHMPQLVNPERGGYYGGAAEHKRFNDAARIDRDSAIESCSWGLFQIMGMHWEALGYDSTEQFASRMAHSEAEQLDAFVRFILAHPALHKALKARKWDKFAEGYNGKAYRANLYDIKLARAFERYAETETVET